MAPNNVVAIRNAAALAGRQHDAASNMAIIRAKFEQATEREFEEFIAYCRVTGLDPIKGEAILVVYGKGNNRKCTIITTQAGLRTIAERCGGYHPAKPGDTVWTYTAYQIERQKWLDEAKVIRQRDEREKVLAEIADNMPPDATNPAGLLECRTIIYKHGQPVEGIALWTSYAPLTPHPDCFEMRDTGEFWQNKDGSPSNRKKLKKIVRPGINLADHMILETSGRWGVAGPDMLEKCANVRALKAAFPDQFGHQVIGEETFDKTIADTWTASELAEQGEIQRRQNAIGIGMYAWPDEHGEVRHFKIGEIGDAILKSVRACQYREDFDKLFAMRVTQETMNLFWANKRNDALDVKAEFERIAEGLPRKPKTAPVAPEQVESGPASA
jgi:hypothetical protein